MVLGEIENYLEDDWNDNSLTNRSANEEGYFLHPSDNLVANSDVEAGDVLKGVYRPDWTIEIGTPSASNNRLELPNASSTSQAVKTPSEFTAGLCSFDRTLNSSTSTGAFRFNIIKEDSNNWWADNLDAGNPHEGLAKKESGTFSQVISTGSGGSVGTNTHSIKITRDSYGRWEYSKNGTSQGTTTDTFLPTPIIVNIGSYTDSIVYVDNLVIK